MNTEQLNAAAEKLADIATEAGSLEQAMQEAVMLLLQKAIADVQAEVKP
jgi:hypothetical protein